MSSKDAFTFGIEEEYFLVSLSRGALVGDPPAGMLERCKSELGKQFASEYQRSQIEVATKVCETMADARADLARLRSAIAVIANEHGLAPMAASTHPFTPWSTQRHTDKQRYRAIADDLKGLGKRMVVGGMHVHVGIEDREQRIGVMNDIRAFLPLRLALSTLVTVLAGREYRPEIVSHGRQRYHAAQWHPRAIRELERLLRDTCATRSIGSDRGRDEDMVGPAAVGPLSDARAQDHGHLSPHRGRPMYRRPVPVSLSASLSTTG